MAWAASPSKLNFLKLTHYNPHAILRKIIYVGKNASIHILGNAMHGHNAFTAN
jgi:hypothetical protein